MSAAGDTSAAARPRPPAVAGLFYPDGRDALRATVDALGAEAASAYPTPGGIDPAGIGGILVPHAGLVYSGTVAAAAWRLVLGVTAADAPTILLLGTNHGAAWLEGVGVWTGGPWSTPLGPVLVEPGLTEAIVGLGPPFAPDTTCHLGEHSLEVQLPFVARWAPSARIVALSVGAGRGGRAIDAGGRLGRLVAERRAGGARIVVAISSDMAHYPPADVSEAITGALLPSIVALAPEELAVAEMEVGRHGPGVSCGMCGIEPTVLGLAALRAMGARPGVALAAATSADAGGDRRRTVGYLAAAFPG